MKKTYHNSPAKFVMTFILFAIAAFLLLVVQGHFVGNEINYVRVIAAIGVLCFLGWASLFITIDSKAITRRLAVFFVSKRNLSEVEDIRSVSDSDMYGTSKFMQIKFKDGDKWNLGMLSKKDLAELLEVIKRHHQA